MKTPEILIARPSNANEVTTLKALLKVLKIKFEVANESPYNPAFVAKIEKSRKDFKLGKGKTVTIGDLQKLWK
ncbi:MAG: hypothetical protein KA713_16665 [Chryseotalea sp. WA131a]|jgi:hypothetical protein|nr:MAG: hypothetical protein KA713_16665 [Chryseotalea sp. WA131a]